MKKKRAGKCILFLFMVALALLYVIPFFMMGLGSFKTQAEAARFDLALPSKWLFSNYTHVLESGKIWLGYLNSIIILSLVLHWPYRLHLFSFCCNIYIYMVLFSL